MELSALKIHVYGSASRNFRLLVKFHEVFTPGLARQVALFQSTELYDLLNLLIMKNRRRMELKARIEKSDKNGMNELCKNRGSG